jgi:hypothetical protein
MHVLLNGDGSPPHFPQNSFHDILCATDDKYLILGLGRTRGNRMCERKFED